MNYKNYTSNQKKAIVKNTYNAIANIYIKRYNEIDYCKIYIDEFIESLSGEKILDFGCGAGQITNYLTKKGFDAIGIDFSQELLKIARRTFPDSKFVLADICEYEQKEQVDGIITKDVLFHLPYEDLIQILKKFKRLLKSSGKLCIIMDLPKGKGEQIIVEELDGKSKIYYNYLDPETLKETLENIGFSINNVQFEKSNILTCVTGIMIFQVGINSRKDLNT